MIKVTIHINSDSFYMDDNVSKDVMLQCLPRVGDTFYLSDETKERFYNIIHEFNLYARYKKWLYGKSSKLEGNDLLSCDKELLQEDFSLDDVCIVCDVFFEENGEIHIELSDHVQTT